MRREPLTCDVCAVRSRAACAALDESDRAELARLGHRRRLKRGETLFAAGNANALCATLISGVLKVSSVDEGGNEHLLSLIHPSGFVGELFAPSAHHDVVAVTDSELCVFPRGQYEAAIERFPPLGHALLRRSSQDLVESRSLLAAVAGRSATQRVAGFILALAWAASETECHPAREIDLVLTRGEIASLLGLKIETVSRQLSKLEADGLIYRKGRGGIGLIDPARLETAAS